MEKTDPNIGTENLLQKRMESLGIKESDLEEKFVRSGGHGGQNVNKTSTCVMMVHKPTGLQVKCQESRHQGMNRQLAREMLFDKIEEQAKKIQAEQKAIAEKIRRKKRGRSFAAKKRILENKSRNSAKKSLRKRSFDD